jgi:hypothetical protein
VKTFKELWKELPGLLALWLLFSLLAILLVGGIIPARDAPVDPRSPWALPEAIWEGRWP